MYNVNQEALDVIRTTLRQFAWVTNLFIYIKLNKKKLITFTVFLSI